MITCITLQTLYPGIDNSVATYGGVVTFCSGSMAPQADLVGLDILLTNTCVGRNTRQLVAAVRERYNMFPKVVEHIMEAVEKLSLAALSTMQACRVKQFSDCEEEFSRLEVCVSHDQREYDCDGIHAEPGGHEPGALGQSRSVTPKPGEGDTNGSSTWSSYQAHRGGRGRGGVQSCHSRHSQGQGGCL